MSDNKSDDKVAPQSYEVSNGYVALGDAVETSRGLRGTFCGVLCSARDRAVVRVEYISDFYEGRARVNELYRVPLKKLTRLTLTPAASASQASQAPQGPYKYGNKVQGKGGRYNNALYTYVAPWPAECGGEKVADRHIVVSRNNNLVWLEGDGIEAYARVQVVKQWVKATECNVYAVVDTKHNKLLGVWEREQPAKDSCRSWQLVMEDQP